MKKSLQNTLFYLLAAAGLGTLIATFIHFRYYNKHAQHVMNYTYPVDPTHSACPEHFIHHVDTLMSSTWQTMESTSGICLGDCQEFLDEYGHEIKDSIQRSIRRSSKKLAPITPETLGYIHEILNDCQISPASITITPFNGQGSPAAADDYTLYIDETDFKSYCPQTQKFLIAHEMSHLKNKDHSIESAIESLIEHKTKDYRKAMSLFSHSTEFRADVNAMLKGIEYTRGGIKFFENLIERYGDTKNSTHPRPSDRLKIARDIEAMYMAQEQQVYPVTGVMAA